MNKVLASLAAALVIYTRVPIPWQLPPQSFAPAVWHLPLLAWGFASLQGAFILVLPWPAGSALQSAVLLALPLLLSGALHEDGLADFCDGQLGGQTPEQRLAIMKDPRVGTYGLLALLGVLSFQFMSLQAIALDRQLAALLISQVGGRGLAVSLIARLPYIQQSDSRAGSYLPAPGLSGGCIYALLTSVAAGLLLDTPLQFLLILSLLIAWQQLWVMGLRRSLRGYTGDCLGAAVKLSETLLLLWSSWLWPRH